MNCSQNNTKRRITKSENTATITNQYFFHCVEVKDQLPNLKYNLSTGIMNTRRKSNTYGIFINAIKELIMIIMSKLNKQNFSLVNLI